MMDDENGAGGGRGVHPKSTTLSSGSSTRDVLRDSSSYTMDEKDMGEKLILPPRIGGVVDDGSSSDCGDGETSGPTTELAAEQQGWETVDDKSKAVDEYADELESPLAYTPMSARSGSSQKSSAPNTARGKQLSPRQKAVVINLPEILEPLTARMPSSGRRGFTPRSPQAIFDPATPPILQKIVMMEVPNSLPLISDQIAAIESIVRFKPKAPVSARRKRHWRDFLPPINSKTEEKKKEMEQKSKMLLETRMDYKYRNSLWESVMQNRILSHTTVKKGANAPVKTEYKTFSLAPGNLPKSINTLTLLSSLGPFFHTLDEIDLSNQCIGPKGNATHHDE